jgi:hypothetical protein
MIKISKITLMIKSKNVSIAICHLTLLKKSQIKWLPGFKVHLNLLPKYLPKQG